MGVSRGDAAPQAESRGESWIAAGLGLAAAGVPLTVNAFGATFLAGYHVLALVLGLVVVADAQLSARVARLPLRIAGPFLALWLVVLASAPFSLDLPAALKRALDSTAALAVLAIAAAGIGGRARSAILLAGILGMAVVAIWGLLQRLGIHPFLDPAIWQPSRPTRPLGTHNLVGGYLAAWLPAALGLALTGRGLPRAAGFVAFLVGLACFLESESRGAWLALAVAGSAATAGLLHREGRAILERAAGSDRRGFRRRAAILGAAAILVGGLAGRTLVERLATREHSGVLTPDDAAPASALTSFERRRLVAQTALALIGERPVLGFGPGSFRLAFYTARPPAMQRLEAETGETAVHAHSDPLELTAELGVVGLLLALAGWALAGRRALGRARGQGPSPAGWAAPGGLVHWGLLIGGTALLLHSVIDFDLHEPPTAFTAALILGLALGYAVPAAGESRAAGRRPLPGLGRLGIAAVLVAGLGLAVIRGHADWAYRKAYRVLAGGDLAASEAWLERARRGVPDEARVWVALGEVARHRAQKTASPADRRGALEEAAERFQRAAAIEPQIAVRWQRAAIAMEEVHAAGVQVFPGTIAALAERAIAANPADPQGYLLLARAAWRDGDVVRAVGVLESLMGGAGDGTDAIPVEARAGLPGRPAGSAALALLSDIAQASTRSGFPLQSADSGRTPAARATRLLEAIARRGGKWGAEAARHLGDLARVAGKREEAHSWYDSARSGGLGVELDLALGHLAREERDFDLAEIYYTRVVRARPDTPEAYEGLSQLAATRGDSSAARRFAEQARRLSGGQ
jgi:O-antigen ligase/tetratricopeptide (TPR) repeat protein